MITHNAVMKFAVGALITLSAAVSAHACVEAPITKHSREIWLIDTGLSTFKRPKDVLAKVKQLRALAETDFSAHKLSEAENERRSALILIGYKLDAAAGSWGRGASAGCGGSGTWVAPSE